MIRYRRGEKMKQIELVVEGMHCQSCQHLIEEALKEQNGVRVARVNVEKKLLKLKYDEKVVTLEALKRVVEKKGYQLWTKDEQKHHQIQVIWAIGLALISYVLLERALPDLSGVLATGESVSFVLLWVVGVTTSFHCVSMCGGMALSQLVHQGNNVKRSVLYNLGRVISYTLLGGIIGALGSFITADLAVFKVLPVGLGIAMVFMGLGKIGIIKLKPTIMGKSVNRTLGHVKRKAGSNHGPFFVGLLNGFMPCGPLQLMQLYALGTGSFTQGALSMFFFSLGTVPLMLGLGVFLTRMSIYARTLVFKIGGALIIVLGLNMTMSGLATLGIGADFSFGSSSRIEAQMDGDIQVVSLNLESRNYGDIVVKKGIPVKLQIEATPRMLNGCNRSLKIPEFNIQMNLDYGNNEVTFTPTKTGTFTYSCWMGMIRNTIKVIE